MLRAKVDMLEERLGAAAGACEAANLQHALIKALAKLQASKTQCMKYKVGYA